MRCKICSTSFDPREDGCYIDEDHILCSDCSESESGRLDEIETRRIKMEMKNEILKKVNELRRNRNDM